MQQHGHAVLRQADVGLDPGDAGGPGGLEGGEGVFRRDTCGPAVADDLDGHSSEHLLKTKPLKRGTPVKGGDVTRDP